MTDTEITSFFQMVLLTTRVQALVKTIHLDFNPIPTTPHAPCHNHTYATTHKNNNTFFLIIIKYLLHLLLELLNLTQDKNSKVKCMQTLSLSHIHANNDSLIHKHLSTCAYNSISSNRDFSSGSLVSNRPVVGYVRHSLQYVPIKLA